jgi:hypothetical protein
MRKTDIAKLVADALETEYKGYKNSEQRHIEAVNDGKHGELKPLLVPTEGQLAEAFKGQRFDWWRELFDEDIDLAYAAGMLQGFSQTMTLDAKFVDAHKPKRKDPKEPPPKSRAPRPIGQELVKKFTLMRRHMDRAIQRSELCAAEGKFAPDELIAWAKEKGFVADEVLEAWEAYKKAKAEQVTVTATSDAMEPEPQTAPETPGEKSIAKWLSVSSDYIAGVMKEGRYGTAKELFKALEAKAGHESSPFEKGTGNNRDSLFVRAIHCHVSMKTMQNNWSEIRSLP